MSALRYSYRVDPLGQVTALGGDGEPALRGTAHVDGIASADHLLRKLGPRERDLLRVARAIANAHRLSLRHPLGSRAIDRLLVTTVAVAASATFNQMGGGA
jgi:hypothetical protein